MKTFKQVKLELKPGDTLFLDYTYVLCLQKLSYHFLQSRSSVIYRKRTSDRFKREWLCTFKGIWIAATEERFCSGRSPSCGAQLESKIAFCAWWRRLRDHFARNRGKKRLLESLRLDKQLSREYIEILAPDVGHRVTFRAIVVSATKSLAANFEEEINSPNAPMKKEIKINDTINLISCILEKKIRIWNQFAIYFCLNKFV